MIKKLMLALLITIALFLFLGCAQKPTVTKSEVTEPSEEIPTTGESSIDEVGTDIADISNVEEDLNTEELEDIDDILLDIENI